MANEARINFGLSINKGSLKHRSSGAFAANVSGQKGPTPGAIAVSTLGTDVDLSQLTVAGLTELTNLDDSNFFEWGIYDPDTLAFYPLGEVGPGETYIIRLSRNIQEQYAGTGTGAGGETARLRLKANGANLAAFVGAFEA